MELIEGRYELLYKEPAVCVVKVDNRIFIGLDNMTDTDQMVEIYSSMEEKPDGRLVSHWVNDLCEMLNTSAGRQMIRKANEDGVIP